MIELFLIILAMFLGAFLGSYLGIYLADKLKKGNKKIKANPWKTE